MLLFIIFSFFLISGTFCMPQNYVPRRFVHEPLRQIVPPGFVRKPELVLVEQYYYCRDEFSIFGIQNICYPYTHSHNKNLDLRPKIIKIINIDDISNNNIPTSTEGIITTTTTRMENDRKNTDLPTEPQVNNIPTTMNEMLPDASLNKKEPTYSDEANDLLNFENINNEDYELVNNNPKIGHNSQMTNSEMELQRLKLWKSQHEKNKLVDDPTDSMLIVSQNCEGNSLLGHDGECHDPFE